VRSSRCVLVVDDEAVLRQTVAEALEMDGYEVCTASNGAEALRQVRVNRPHAVVLDLMMPVMNGWQFLKACHDDDLCKEIPVIVMSAFHHLTEEAPGLGISAWFEKPFDLDTLLQTVERLTSMHPRL
jgi:two-component system chemotaxis response regulator CheY